MVLIHRDLFAVIKAAILGSILANLLLCLGICFFVGGLQRHEQEFHEVVSEVGNGLLLMAGFGLLIPTAFYTSLNGTAGLTAERLQSEVLNISRIASIILLAAFVMFVAPLLQSSSAY